MTEPWAHIRRVQLATPDALASMPAVLGCHAFTWVLEAVVDKELSPNVGALWTLDPGGDVGEWKSLPWFDSDGRQHRVTTRNDEPSAVRLERLADKAWRWAVPVPYEDPGLVEIHPLQTRRVGRGGALVDAQLADPDARAIDHEVVYAEGDAAGFVREEVRRLGPVRFHQRYDVPLDTAKRISAGRAPSARVAARVVEAMRRAAPGDECALESCDEPLGAGARKFCSPAHAKAHRDRAYRQRHKARASMPARRTRITRPVKVTEPPDNEVTCPGCGTYLLGFAPGELCDECKESDDA